MRRRTIRSRRRVAGRHKRPRQVSGPPDGPGETQPDPAWVGFFLGGWPRQRRETHGVAGPATAETSQPPDDRALAFLAGHEPFLRRRLLVLGDSSTGKNQSRAGLR